jgi:hypothetical protein
VRDCKYDNCTVHWIYRKALFKGDLRNHKGRDVSRLNRKERGQSNRSVRGLCGVGSRTLY